VFSVAAARPVCECFPGYAGEACERFCPHNCTVDPLTGGARGRCSAALECVCKEGFSGPDCSQTCPSRCFGHGECVDGACACRPGYAGADCSQVAPPTGGELLLLVLQGASPALLVGALAVLGTFGACTVGYVLNRSRGRAGTAAIPMWAYLSKRWADAPLFEPMRSPGAPSPHGSPYVPYGARGARYAGYP
jgi:hypothetical protein